MLVLIADDSHTMRLLIRHALHSIEGAEVIEAKDGADALAKLTEVKPDVIVTDLNMPVMDGFALIEQVRARPELAHIPVVVLTTAGAIPESQRVRPAALLTYVTKPIRPDTLVEAVRAAAASRR